MIKTFPKRKVKYTRPEDCKLKPHVVPDGMIVKIDTREQRPLWMPKPPKNLVIMRTTLHDGDYTIGGFENSFAIERKSSDLFPYLTSEREKTKAKLVRLLDYEFKAIVIEFEEAELYSPKLFTEISPEVIRQSLVSFEIKYGIHIFYGNREALERKVLDWMIYFWKFKHNL